MFAILSLQSHVAYGHVGNSAVVFPLQRLGREVWPIHTVQFSCHAGYPGWRGRTTSPEGIAECVAGLDAIGVLSRCAGALTGYLGRVETAEAALAAIAVLRSRNPDAAYACDPVIGDEGRGVYVTEGWPEFFRDRALPAATVASPNAFELALLSGADVNSRGQAVAALQSMRARGPRVAFATSLKLEDTPADALDMIVADGEGAWRVRTPRLSVHVNGAGDLISALFFHHWLDTRDAAGSLAQAAARVYAVVLATAESGSRELALVSAQDRLAAPALQFAPERL